MDDICLANSKEEIMVILNRVFADMSKRDLIEKEING
jgi:hypothetical protein